MTKRVPVFVTSAAGGGGGGGEGAGGEAASERSRWGRRKGSLVAMEGLRGRGARRLWACGCRWASSRLIAPAAGRRETTTDPQIGAGVKSEEKGFRVSGWAQLAEKKKCLVQVISFLWSK